MQVKNYLLVVLSLCSVFAYGQRQGDQTIKVAPKFLKFEEAKSINANQIFAEQLDLSDQDEMTLIKTDMDALGMTHKKYQQQYKGVNIEGAQYFLHQKNNTTISMNGDFRILKNDVNVTPQISEDNALNFAKSHIGATEYSWESKNDVHPEHDHGQHLKPVGDLVLLTKENGVDNITLAYKFDIFSSEPVKRSYVYVNALTGDIALEVNRIQCNDAPITGNSLYNGNVQMIGDYTGSNYRLRQAASGDGIETYDMNNGTSYGNATDITSSGSNFTGSETGVQAHYGAEQTYDYFFTSHNRDSYNGNGAVIKSYVSYGVNYVNAFWNGSVMTYGDGDGTNYGPLVSLDIVGHEITHGVTEYSANLVYSYESGALNESFSDIFGESIENYAQGNNDWLMGDHIGAGGSGGALRNMANPNQFGDPDTYGGTNWHTASSDNGGVHINSGVQNKWFYILCQGESGTNDNGDSYSVASIGMTKAGAIAYRNLTTYLTTNSQYSDARTGAIQSAEDLYGAGSPEVIATTNAWYAVGVGGEYGTTSYCNSKGNTFNEEYISNVQLNTINHPSGQAGYSDHTAISTDLNKSQTYTITVTPDWPGSTYSEGYSVWIDYNQDGSFGSTEQVWTQAPTQATPVSGSFTVPSSALDGPTRMRVSLKYNGIPTACETFSYGEVEDYTVNIGSGGTSDTENPTDPTALTASNTTQNSTDLDWNASSDNVDVTGYNVYVNGNLDGTTTSTSYSVNGLSASTTYALSVSAFDAAGNMSGQASTSVTTNSPPSDTQAPSTPNGLSTNNTTQTSTNLSWNASSDNVGVTGYNVYVDGNYDGSTTSTNYAVNGLTASTTYTLSVDAYDAAGNTSGQGSTNVTTNSPPNDTQAPSTPNGLATNNTTQTSTDLSWNASSDNVGVTGYNVYVDGNYDGSTTSTSYAVSGLSSSTTYTLSVNAYDAAGNTSSQGSTNVTTDSPPNPGGSTVLSAHYFETGWDGWQDGGGDCARYYGSRSYEGNRSIRIRDNSSTASSMTSSTYNLTSYDAVEINFYFYPNSMEYNEDFWVRYNDGGGWQTAAAYARGTHFNNNTFYVATVTLSSTDYDFVSDGRFRFQCDASSNADRVYIDAVTITGVNNTGFGISKSSQTVTAIGNNGFLDMNDPLFEEDIKIFPNPAQDEITYNLSSDNAEIVEIYNLNGQLIYRNDDIDEDNTINVSAFSTGLYIMSITTEEEVVTAKFYKK